MEDDEERKTLFDVVYGRKSEVCAESSQMLFYLSRKSQFWPGSDITCNKQSCYKYELKDHSCKLHSVRAQWSHRMFRTHCNIHCTELLTFDHAFPVSDYGRSKPETLVF